jgi:hypothetical protein
MDDSRRKLGIPGLLVTLRRAEQLMRRGVVMQVFGVYGIRDNLEVVPIDIPDRTEQSTQP